MSRKILLPDDTGASTEIELFSAAEVAGMLPVSESFVRERMLSGEWESMMWGHRRYMTLAHVRGAVEWATRGGQAIPERTEPPQLGTPVSDTDIEPIR